MRPLSLALLTLLLPTLAQAEPTPLTGTILSSDGQPVPNATIFVFVANYPANAPADSLTQLARARQGEVVRTDAAGNFTLSNFDDRLKVSVKILAPGGRYLYETLQFRSSNRIRLPAPTPNPTTNPSAHVRGSIVNAEGRPVEGAIISVNSITTGPNNDGLTFNTDDLLNSDAVTDSDGNFVIPTRGSGFKAKLIVYAPNLGEAIVDGVTPDTPVSVRLEPGVTIHGKVIDQQTGQPAPLAPVFVQLNTPRMVGLFRRYAITDANGAYSISGLKPATTRSISLLTSELGSSPEINVSLPPSTPSLQVPDLPRSPGRRLRGRIVPNDGRPLPPMSRISLSMGLGNSDDLERELDDLGNFEFTGLSATRPVFLRIWAPDDLAFDTQYRSYNKDFQSVVGLVPENDIIVEIPVTRNKPTPPPPRLTPPPTTNPTTRSTTRPTRRDRLSILSTQPLR